ncbi:hypothetical protein [Companilactobacillus sp. HBUAS59544]
MNKDEVLKRAREGGNLHFNGEEQKLVDVVEANCIYVRSPAKKLRTLNY